MLPLVAAVLIAVFVVGALSWPWWAGIVAFIVAAPALAAATALIAVRTGQGSRLLRATGGPSAGSPNYAIVEAFVAYAGASRVGEYEQAAELWEVLRNAARAANAVDVLQAMDGAERFSGVNFEERSAKAAIHRLRLAIEAL